MPKKSTLELAKEIYNDIQCYGISVNQAWIKPETWGYDQTLAAVQKAEELTNFAYEEEKIEEILKRVINKNKEILINLIKEENALSKEEKEAVLAVQKLKLAREKLIKNAKSGGGLNRDDLLVFLRQVVIISNLLEKDARIEQALSVIASDLAAIVASLNSAKQIK